MTELTVSKGISIINDVDLGQITQTMNKIAKFQSVVQNTLKKDHDYGTIPGTQKPTLYKPGAEKILMLMGITSQYEIIERVQDYDNGFFAFSVKCILFRGDNKITEGVGHCNTKEDKYRYRWAFDNEVPEGLDKQTLKSKQFGKYTKYQLENDEPYSLVNTVLKMAKKRAQIDATLTVAALSEIFTQDLEDMKDFIEQENIQTMDTGDASDVVVTFGKHKGKTLGQIVVDDESYVKWLSENGRDEYMRKAATEVLLGNGKEETATTKDNDGFIPVDDDELPFK